MTNVKPVDVDAIVAKARELAKTHGWCEVVDEALEELGLVNTQKVSGFLTFKIALEDIRVEGDPQKWFKDNVSVYVAAENQKSGEYLFDDHIEAAFEVSDVNKADGTNLATGNWYYSSNEGRVLHRRSNDYNWSYLCGAYRNRASETRHSPRGENRRCKRCETR